MFRRVLDFDLPTTGRRPCEKPAHHTNCPIQQKRFAHCTGIISRQLGIVVVTFRRPVLSTCHLKVYFPPSRPRLLLHAVTAQIAIFEWPRTLATRFSIIVSYCPCPEHDSREGLDENALAGTRRRFNRLTYCSIGTKRSRRRS